MIGAMRANWLVPAVRGALSATMVVALAACGGDDDTASDGSDTGGGSAAVTIEGFSFDASPVDAGEAITIENLDDVTHTFTADNGGFDVRVDGNATAETTAPGEPGTYAFHCEIHPSMKGDLVVG
jgi:plastocyanin